MQNARKNTKAVVNNLVGFGIASVTSSVVRNNIKRSNNPVIDTVIGVSAFATSWFVSSTVENPVRTETERQIDAVFDALEASKKNNQQ